MIINIMSLTELINYYFKIIMFFRHWVLKQFTFSGVWWWHNLNRVNFKKYQTLARCPTERYTHLKWYNICTRCSCAIRDQTKSRLRLTAGVRSLSARFSSPSKLMLAALKGTVWLNSTLPFGTVFVGGI